ncbi:thioredoxin-domain-containing protein [Trichoderma citrinoviride]|uniref:protein disulfide-isomerase n=1 Tax=Trichoderma citrinoviride TaxID=58853 RepID=A0A2T4BED8_9HYPO|nr:thioredoxin-domain-containing protein [Trichoderma citrinoviride]PTB67675.1 thioredoxin-domain-containing protein [Trichoderma citrinoviride]
MHQQTLLATLAASLAALPFAQAGFYPKNSPVLQVDAKSFDRLITKSNHTSIVEFYAPWCGHCQNLKPAYEKAARNLDGLAKVAAVDCDDDANKALCGAQGVKGFPTLKIVRPGKKPGRPVVEDYQGQRTAGAIVDAVVSKINNHVVKLTDKDIDAFLDKDGEKPKAILFTEKGTTSALLRSLAIDFLDAVTIGQVRNKEKAAVERFGISSFPSFVLVPGAGKEPIVYSGELNKKDMVEFLRQVAEPNPDPAPSTAKPGSKKTSSKDKAGKEAPKADDSSSTASSETSTAAAPESTLIDIPALTSKADLESHCLQPKSQTCVLAFVPASTSEMRNKILSAVSQLHTKYVHGKRHFPFFSVDSDVEGVAAIKEALGLSGKIELVALNARRGWWRRYEDGEFSVHSVESWIDAVRMGEGEKQKLPEGIVVEKAEPSEEAKAGTEAPAAEEAAESEHDEL